MGAPERVRQTDTIAHLMRAALEGLAMGSLFISRPTDDALRVLALLKRLRQSLVAELQMPKT